MSVRSVDRFIAAIYGFKGSGAVIQRGYFCINVKTVNQSLKLTLEESLLA